MRLRPSDICYTQDSIQPFFDTRSLHSAHMIGETLDDLCENRCSINDIPTISVIWKNGNWFTADNRRLWVFRHLERLGKCSTVPVQITSYVSPSKFTSLNGGESIRVRGYPGGSWYQRQPTDFSYRSPVYKAQGRGTGAVSHTLIGTTLFPDYRHGYRAEGGDFFSAQPAIRSECSYVGERTSNMGPCLLAFVIIVIFIIAIAVKP